MTRLLLRHRRLLRLGAIGSPLALLLLALSGGSAPNLEAAAGLSLFFLLAWGFDLYYGSASAKLRDSNESLRAVIEASPHAIFDVDREGRIASIWNPAAERLFGWKRGEVIGRFNPTVPEACIDEFHAALHRVFRGETLRAFERTRRCKDGSEVRISIAVGPIHDPKGRICAVMAVVEDVTLRHEQETRIAYQAQLLETVSDAIVATDTGSRITAWNQAAERLYGWTALEVLGRPIREVLQTEFPSLSWEQYRTVLRATSGYQGEVMHRRRDGSSIPVEVKVGAVRSPSGEIVGWVGSNRDLSPRHAAERALAESEERFSRLAGNLPDMIYRLRLFPSFAFEYVSSAATAITGYTPEDYYADPELAFKTVHPDDLDKLLARTLDPAGLLGESMILRWTHRDGRLVWREDRYVPIPDATGRIVAVEGSSRDITASVAAEAERSRLATVIEQSEEAVIISERDGRISYVNAAFSRITGYSRAEAIGANPRLLKSGVQDPDFYAKLWATLLTGGVWRGRLTNRRRDGTFYTADALISPVRDSTGAVTHYVGIQRDVTHDLRRDEQLRQAQKMEAVGELTGGIAHDFNNVLTVVLANLSLLEGDLPPGDPVAAPYLRDIEQAARRGAEMVRKLLVFGRRETLSLQTLQLSDVVAEVTQTLRRVLPESIEVRFDPAPELPHVKADPTSIEQMLLNLATNARDAMPDGGTLTLRIRLHRPADEEGEGDLGPASLVALEVSDTGSGMSSETLRHLFEPFYTTKGAGRGTGLGMAMVYGLIKQHGGEVRVSSELGRGSVVTLLFPIEPCQAECAPKTTVVRTPGGNERILLVEDEASLRRVARLGLERLGYEVTEAADGREAIAVLECDDAGYDLILSDIVMPNLGGVQLSEELGRRSVATPILLCTGYAESEQLERLERSRIPLLRKPWTLEELAIKVRETLDQGIARAA